MIVTLSDDERSMVWTKLVAKDKAEIERLCRLYETVDFELGYLNHGVVNFLRERPKNIVITRDSIQIFDAYQWGKDGVNGLFPVEFLTTKANNTLIIIRQLLELESDYNFKLRSFFSDSSKQIHSTGALVRTPFDLTLQLKKLKCILESKEVSLSLLKDAYFDFYLFVELLSKVDLETKTSSIFETLYTEAVENTAILNTAKAFVKKLTI